MDNFRIPPSPAWYTQPVCSPENGLLYIAGNHTSIAYIPPTENQVKTDESPNVQIIQTQNQFKSIACDPNWSTSKWFVTMNEQNIIWVWNLETAKICRGHKAHVDSTSNSRHSRHNDTDSQLGGTMCVTRNRKVLSIDRNAFVQYCLVSNTYSFFSENFILKRGTVSLLEPSPYSLDTIAVGYKNGLIVIANYADQCILQHLRRHDSEIVSLQWTMMKPETNGNIKTDFKSKVNSEQESKATKSEIVIPKLVVPEQPTPNVTPSKKLAPKPSSSKQEASKLTPSKSKLNKAENTKTRREAPKPIVDAGDMFDIHSYDYLEDEFGTISSNTSTWKEARKDTSTAPKTTANDANFNFIEECQSLQEQMKANESDSDSQSAVSNQSAVNMADIRNMMKARGSVPKSNDSIDLPDGSDGSADEVDEFSNRSTIGSSHNTTDIAELEDVIQNLNIDDTPSKDLSSVVYLVSGAQESYIVLWNPEDGSIVNQLHLKSQGKMKIPKSNCTIVWVRPNELVVNGPDGKISQWKAKNDEQTQKTIFTPVDVDYPDMAVINICSNVQYSSKPIVWTFSTYLNIIGHRFDEASSEIFAKFSTLPIGMLALRECPHDPNKIAIAGNNKRIGILNLSTLKKDNVEIQSLTSKIQGKVLALAWHPLNENLLSFSTNEGRIGTFNISKTSSAPDLMMNFNGKDLYSLCYSVVGADAKKCILYASNGTKLMMFNENATKNDNHEFITFPVSISSVSVNEKYIAIGFANGSLEIRLNNQEKTKEYSEILSKKYLSEMSWSPVNRDKIAVSASDNNIFILERDENSFKTSGKLTEHLAGVTFVQWSSQSEHKLVSTSFDHTVRVWDTQTLECIAWCEYENKMFCATFLPTDENFIVCSGQSETMHIFKIDDRLVAKVGAHDGKSKKKTFNGEVQWGSLLQNDASKLRAQEKKNLKKLEKKSAEGVDEIADRLKAVNVSQSSVKLNHTTILYLTSKELNKEPLDHLQRLLQNSSTPNENGDTNKTPKLLHTKLFGDREEVVEVLTDELKNHKGSKTDSIGNLLIPQMKFELKAHIVQSIEEKRLTEQHVSLAPSISYEFWKNCSLAYANQCIEQGHVLQAIPHLLATQHTNDAIEKLCDAHFYREALSIAKMYKEPEENIFDSIATKWVKHLEQMGNLESAALISFLADKRDLAFEILNKRKSKTPQIEEILKDLSQKATK